MYLLIGTWRVTVAAADECKYFCRLRCTVVKESSLKVTPLLVAKSFGCLGDGELVNQLADHVAGSVEVGYITMKDVLKKRLLLMMFMATQVPVSRRVYRYRLVLCTIKQRGCKLLELPSGIRACVRCRATKGVLCARAGHGTRAQSVAAERGGPYLVRRVTALVVCVRGVWLAYFWLCACMCAYEGGVADIIGRSLCGLSCNFVLLAHSSVVGLVRYKYRLAIFIPYSR